MSDVKNPRVEGTGDSNGLPFVSREQWLQTASGSLPDKQFEREHDLYESKDASLKLALPVMCTTASWRGGLRLCGLWKIQTSRLPSKLSCAMTPSNANQLCSRKTISMSASTWKLSDLNKGFFMKLRELFLRIGICLCHGGMARMDFKVESEDEIMCSKHFFYNQQPREEHVSLKSIFLSEQSKLLFYK